MTLLALLTIFLLVQGISSFFSTSRKWLSCSIRGRRACQKVDVIQVKGTNAFADEIIGWNETFAHGLFLQNYWQKKPLMIRNAFQKDVTDIFPFKEDDFSAFASDEDFESRIITQHRSKYAVRHGPIKRKDFQSHPLTNWTIMFQEVDRHLPCVADVWEEYFKFIPSWRRDDVMISYSMPGGGIGGHVDNYDVFLIQGR